MLFPNVSKPFVPICGRTAATACNGAHRSGSSSLAHPQSHQIHSKRFDATFDKTIYSLKLFSIYKSADESILEKPNLYDDGQGWIWTEDGVLEPVWSCGTALPNSLVDFLDTGDRDDEEEEEEEIEDGPV